MTDLELGRTALGARLLGAGLGLRLGLGGAFVVAGAGSSAAGRAGAAFDSGAGAAGGVFVGASAGTAAIICVGRSSVDGALVPAAEGDVFFAPVSAFPGALVSRFSDVLAAGFSPVVCFAPDVASAPEGSDVVAPAVGSADSVDGTSSRTAGITDVASGFDFVVRAYSAFDSGRRAVTAGRVPFFLAAPWAFVAGALVVLFDLPVC